MKTVSKARFFILVLMMGALFVASQASAAVPIGEISSFKGVVILQSGTEFRRVTKVGQVVNQGDRIQTRQSLVRITFNDGAVMKVRPFTTASIQEREEKSGLWFFKSKKAVRRITCFVGKLWFKSGASKRQNFLQTPTAVCGLRGSDGDIGYDNLNTYLNMYSGEASVIGDVIRGFFDDPGQDAAVKNALYNMLAAAYDAFEKAGVSGTEEDKSAAAVAALKSLVEAAKALVDNPDPVVSDDADKALKDAVDLLEGAIDDYDKDDKDDKTTLTTSSTTTSTTTTKEVTISPSH